MPVLGTRGGGAARGFGFGGGSEDFMVATGGSISTAGDFKIHTFTSSGTFEVTQEYTNPGNYPVEVLVVAGGGGGGDGGGNGGAGGAGGYLQGTFTNLSTASYPVGIGNGGNTNNNGNSNGQAGSNSTFNGATANGGGSGGGGGQGGGTGGAGGSSGGGARGGGGAWRRPARDVP